MRTRKRPGEVFLVGAGPGDAGLITRRGYDLLKTADVIVMDALVNPDLVRPWKKHVIDVGKRGPGAEEPARVRWSQAKINRLLLRLARSGRRVVRLKGGDPFVFGRGSEERDVLQRAGIRCTVVPGVSSAIGGPTAVGLPLTDRRLASQVTFLTGHEGRSGAVEGPSVDWKKLSPRGTLVILMGVARWPSIQSRLLSAGWPGSKAVAAIEWATTDQQRVITAPLSGSARVFRESRLRAPAIIVVGDVAERLDRRPLLGRSVVITRPSGRKDDLSRRLRSAGARVILSPAIRIQPALRLSAWRRLVAAPKDARPFDGIIFLSVNGVRMLHGLPFRLRKALQGIPSAAVGPATASAARAAGWRVSRIAEEHNAAGVLKSLGAVRGRRFLVPRVAGGPDDFVRALRSRGARVQEEAVYRTVFLRMPPAIRKSILNGVDAVCFTSSSTVRSFAANFSAATLRAISKRTWAVSIGKETTHTLKQLHWDRVCEAAAATMADVAAAAVAALR